MERDKWITVLQRKNCFNLEDEVPEGEECQEMTINTITSTSITLRTRLNGAEEYSSRSLCQKIYLTICTRSP